MILAVAITVFAVIAVLFGICLFVFITSYKSYSSGDNDELPENNDNEDEIRAEKNRRRIKNENAESETAANEAAKREAEKAAEKAAAEEAAAEKAAAERAAEEAAAEEAAEKAESFDTRIATPEEMERIRGAALRKDGSARAEADSSSFPSAPGSENAPESDIDEESAKAGISRYIPFITAGVAVIAAICIGVLIFVMVSSRAPKPDTAPETADITTEDIRLQENITGSISSPDTLTSIFAANGKITDVKVKAGDYVKKGDIIYMIDSSNLQARIDLLEERLSVVKADTDAENVEVTAPASGTITSLYVSSGSPVSGGTTIAEITTPSENTVSVTIGASVNVGDKVSVSSGGDTVEGVVTAVREIPAEPEDEIGGDLSEENTDVPSSSWHVNVSFTTPGETGSVAVVTVDGQKASGQVVKGRSLTVRVTARAAGNITNMNIEAGDKVSEGERIAEIETPASAQAAQNEFEAKELQLEIDQLNSELENYTLRASVDGYVQQLYAKEGDNAAINMTAVSLTPQDSLALKVELPAETAEKLTLPAPVSFKLSRTSDFSDDVWAELDTETVYHVTLTSLEPDESGEVYVGYIPLEEQDKVRSGMVAQMNITTYTAYNAIVIPEALIKDGKVKILSAEGVKEVKVKTGVVTENGVEITDGLSRGDKLVLN